MCVVCLVHKMIGTVSGWSILILYNHTVPPNLYKKCNLTKCFCDVTKCLYLYGTNIHYNW